MTTPKQDLENIAALLEKGRESMANKQWQDAERAVNQAIGLDNMNPGACDLMADIQDAQGNAPKAEEWREKARGIRKEAWKRQVEAEARGRHEILGEPARREIP